MIRLDEITIDRKLRRISHLGVTHQFYPKGCLFEISCHLLLGGGLSAEDIFEKVYRDDPTGGPDGQDKLITSHIWRSFELFRKLSLSLMAERRGGRARYWLEPKRSDHTETYAMRAIKYGKKPPGRPRASDVNLKGELLC